MSLRNGIIIGIGIILSPALASAASGDTMNGSGSSLDAARSAQWQERATNLRSQVLQSRTELQALRTKMITTRTAQTTNRHDCQERLRKANRDTRLRTLLACYGEDLTFIRTFYDLQRQEISVLPGVSPERRLLAKQRLQILDEAIATILDGLTVHVFSSEAEALETKQNLQKHYVLPAQHMLLAARAERMRAWIAHLGTRMHAIEETYAENPDMTEKMTKALHCLVQADDQVQAALDKENNEGNRIDLSQAQSTMKLCIADVHAAAKAERLLERTSAN